MIIKIEFDTQTKSGRKIQAYIEKTTDKNEMIRILLEIVSKCLDDKTVMERNIRKIDN